MQLDFLSFEYDSENSLLTTFTLVNKPSDENSFTDQTWAFDFFPYAYDSDHRKGHLRLYFQSNPDAEPNPWISKQLAKRNSVPDVVREDFRDLEDFLWRGSIFAVMMDEEEGKSLLQEDCAFLAEVESFLANEFQAMTKEEDDKISDRLAEERREIEWRKDMFSKRQKIHISLTELKDSISRVLV